MPSCCCVPGCRSNYKNETETVAVFQIPADKERRALWIKKIPRKDWVPGARSVVCIKHFKSNDIISEDSIQRPDGSLLVVPRSNLKLKKDASPCIFRELPAYLSETPSTSRKDPNDRHLEQVSREKQKIEDFLASDLIKTIVDVKSFLVNRKSWHSVFDGDNVFFYKLDLKHKPISISSSISISKDLMVEVFIAQRKVASEKLTWLLKRKATLSLLERWSQLENLFVFIENNESYPTLELDQILTDLKNYVEQEKIKETDDTVLNRIKFFYEQLHLSEKNPKARRYSPELLAWSFLIHTKSPMCYREIRDTGVLCVPHPRNLDKLSSTIKVDGTSDQTFLKAKAAKLEQHELVVNLLLDEIIIRPQISYSASANTLTGFSNNKTMQKANSVQCFMISSLYSDNKDVVALLPVKNLNAQELLEMTKAVIAAVTKAGFHIISAIADNNRINRNMFAELCGGILKTFIQNPFNTSIPLFLLFDSVHILKGLRNNWLNQKNVGTTFFFPPFEQASSDELFGASFDDLRNVHFNEKNEIVKIAPKLNEKALFPSSVERQNVNLCLRIFHESNIHALVTLDEVKYKGIIAFLQIVVKWWKIANIKNTRKGYEKLDSDSIPFSSISDERMQFLFSLARWLKEWQIKKIPGMKRNQGKLTSETFFAFQHTVQALADIVTYLVKEKKDRFVLTGKFQTDNLEGRFGQYRQLNGGNYNLSVDQVLKSEKKLRITSLLKLRSESYGEIPISNFMADFAENAATEEICDNIELKGFGDNFQFENEEDIPASLYISGYAVHQLKKKLPCSSCIEMLSMDKNLVVETNKSSQNYFNLVEKGGLMYPNEFITRVFLLCIKVFNCMLRRDNEHLLLIDNVKKILISLTYDKIIEMDINRYCPSCGEGSHNLALKCVSIFFNIFLSNYVKVKNNVVHSSCQKRKFDMLMASV